MIIDMVELEYTEEEIETLGFEPLSDDAIDIIVREVEITMGSAAQFGPKPTCNCTVMASPCSGSG